MKQEQHAKKLRRPQLHEVRGWILLTNQKKETLYICHKKHHDDLEYGGDDGATLPHQELDAASNS